MNAKELAKKLKNANENASYWEERYEVLRRTVSDYFKARYETQEMGRSLKKDVERG